MMAINRKAGRPRIYVPSQLIEHLKNQGLSFRQIAAITGYSYSTIRRTAKEIALAGRRSTRARRAGS
jgi:hypothetical protein